MNVAAREAPLFDPAIRVEDRAMEAWLSQVTLRLRREVAWCRRQRAAHDGAPESPLPQFTDAAQDSLDLLRFRADKRDFFATDVTARFLGERIDAAGPRESGRGLWTRVARALGLDEAAQFVLACALAARADASVGAVAASVLNDASRPHPTLALAQRLWDDPIAIVPCAQPAHMLYRSGLLRFPAARDGLEWSAPLEMPAIVAQALLGAPAPGGLAGMTAATGGAKRDLSHAGALLWWVAATPVSAMQVVPVQVRRGADTSAWVAALCRSAGRRLARIDDELTQEHASLPGVACAAWLLEIDLLAPDHWAERTLPAGADAWIASLSAIPVRWFVPVAEPGAVRQFMSALVAPAFQVPALEVTERARRLRSAMPASKGRRAAAAADAMDVARRFRIEERPLARVEKALRARGRAPVTRTELAALAHAEAALDLENLAQPVAPRFALDELVLPERQRRQLLAIVTAMRSLTRVHYDWGCARAWSEAGLAVMFSGPPGTGKTMAAEALAAELALPMYRIDLSQVVNKYIGETEKNLRRVFDAAEACDCLLFFDEADALFGKRTEVRDSHDRFANIEISYLLERMERFKGLAVLATNRPRDCDAAFSRRLRYVLEFPLPGPAERERIWRQAFPAGARAAKLDFPFLARSFEIAGGHIRSAAFNACLAAAGRPGRSRVGMRDVLLAVQRELEKGGSLVGAEQFGRYARMLKVPA